MVMKISCNKTRRIHFSQSC